MKRGYLLLEELPADKCNIKIKEASRAAHVLVQGMKENLQVLAIVTTAIKAYCKDTGIDAQGFLNHINKLPS